MTGTHQVRLWSDTRWFGLAMMVLAVALLTGCAWIVGMDEPDGERLVISFTPEADPIHLELDAQGLAAYLAAELGVPVETRVDADYAGTVEAMRVGHAHIATNLAPLQAAVAVERAGARLILAEERDGRAYYRSRFWVLKESGITELEDLRGRTIAFNDPLSGSGYLMPVATLIDQELIADGSQLEGFFDQVWFAGGTELSIRALVNGHVEAAGVSEHAAEIFLNEEDREKVTFIAESVGMPRHAIAVSGELPEELVEAITQAFLKLNEPEHNAILEGLYGWRRVVPADEALYLPLLEMAEAVGILGDDAAGPVQAFVEWLGGLMDRLRGTGD